MILEQVDQGRLQLVSSEMIDVEVKAISDVERRRRIEVILHGPGERVKLNLPILRQGRKLVSWGLKPADAVHVAAAEALHAPFLLTCDDRLLRCPSRHRGKLKVSVCDPVTFVNEVLGASNAE